jgi:protein arginine N-methyltransferase 2
MEPALNESMLTDARHLLQLLTDGRPTQSILQYLATKPNLPLWVQEEETGWSVLHFAALREDPSLIQAFIDAGAVWNLGNYFNRGWRNSSLTIIQPVDILGYTAGDVALSVNNSECYRMIRDAGLRSGTYGDPDLYLASQPIRAPSSSLKR